MALRPRDHREIRLDSALATGLRVFPSDSESQGLQAPRPFVILGREGWRENIIHMLIHFPVFGARPDFDILFFYPLVKGTETEQRHKKQQIREHDIFSLLLPAVWQKWSITYEDLDVCYLQKTKLGHLLVTFEFQIQPKNSYSANISSRHFPSWTLLSLGVFPLHDSLNLDWKEWFSWDERFLL